MKYWRGRITRWLNDDPTYAGLVELHAVDASGREWVFVDKLPIFTIENHTAATLYPVDGYVGCDVVSGGPETSAVRTVWTEGVLASAESINGIITDGTSEFEVRSTDLVSPPGYA